MKLLSGFFASFCCFCLALTGVGSRARGSEGIGQSSSSAFASVAFTEIAEFGAGPTLTVSCGDYDNDGDLDLAVGNNAGGNQLYTNNGNGTFTGAGQFGTGSFAPSTFALAWGDFDNDGDLDMAVGNSGQNKLYVNNGAGSFSSTSQFGVSETITMAWADFDLDGDIDLAVGNGILGGNQQNYLYVNNGDGTFTARAEFGIFQTQTMAWGDFDKDGDPDLAVGNGGFGTNQPNFLYINNGNGTYTARAEFGSGGAANADTTSLQWGDFDNDGDLDMAVGNWNNTQCKLYVNNGDGTFTGRSEFGSRDTNAVAWGDYNNDGFLDLAAANGDFSSADQNYLYVNNGNGTFTETAEFGLGSTDALVWGDFDNDGDLDVVSGNEHSPSQNYLYVNNVDNNASLRLHLVGHFHDQGLGYSNRDGIGAKISVYEAGGLGDPARLLGYREIEAHSGFAPQNAIDAHFGLQGHVEVDVRIIWPESGGFRLPQDLRGIAVGQRLIVHEAKIPMAVGADPSGIAKTRFISFVLPAGNAGHQSALRVKFTSLHNVVPAYPNPTNLPIPFTLFQGQSEYVGPPVQYTESLSDPTTFWASKLQCTPYYQDWSTVGLLHVTGEAIIPSSSYDVEDLAASCAGNEATCTAVSAPLTIATARFGDVIISGAANFPDIQAEVAKYQNKPGAPIKARSKIATTNTRGLINITLDVGFADISADVAAYQGKPYPYKPGKCTGAPATACKDDTECVGTGPCILCP